MIREKELGPSGAKDENGECHDVHFDPHGDEPTVAGMEIGDEGLVRVRDDEIIQKTDADDELEHEFF